MADALDVTGRVTEVLSAGQTNGPIFTCADAQIYWMYGEGTFANHYALYRCAFSADTRVAGSWHEIDEYDAATDQLNERLLPLRIYQVRRKSGNATPDETLWASTHTPWSTRVWHGPIASTPPELVSVTATPGNTEATLTWEEYSGDTKPGTEYLPTTKLERRHKLATASVWGAWADVALTDTDAVITGLTNDAEYDFEMRTVNNFGDSEATPAVATPTA